MKTLRSAVANAIARAGKAKLHEGDLVVSEVTVGPGPTLKRWQPGPRGSATPIRKRSVHVRVRVTSRDAAEK
jgi:large subunit ribosomal protein L22